MIKLAPDATSKADVLAYVEACSLGEMKSFVQSIDAEFPNLDVELSYKQGAKVHAAHEAMLKSTIDKGVWAAVAASENLSADNQFHFFLDMYAKLPLSVKKNLADNLNVIEKLQVKIARDPKSDLLKMKLAANLNVCPDAQFILAEDESELVQMELVNNPNTLPEVQEILFRQGSEEIRYALEQKPNFTYPAAQNGLNP